MLLSYKKYTLLFKLLFHHNNFQNLTQKWKEKFSNFYRICVCCELNAIPYYRSLVTSEKSTPRPWRCSGSCAAYTSSCRFTKIVSDMDCFHISQNTQKSVALNRFHSRLPAFSIQYMMHVQLLSTTLQIVLDHWQFHQALSNSNKSFL